MDTSPAVDSAPTVRAAILGTGNIARFHAEALSALPDQVEVVAVADVNEEARTTFANHLAVPRSYGDLATLLDEVSPDLVHVCTPPGLHRDQVLACLQAGSSALVEKPPTLSTAELEELAAAEGTRGPWVATVFQHRFGSGALRAREMLASGALGRPLVAVCHTTWFREQSYFDVPWRGRWDTEGGGPTMGHGIHQMDLLLALLGDWVRVSATARRQARAIDTEDVSLAHVDFANGAVASIVNSLLSPREESYLRIDCERATLELTHLYGYGDDNWRITPAPGHEEDVWAAWRSGPQGVNSGHSAQVAHVLRCLRANEAPPVTSTEALRTMRLVAGVYASAFLERPISPADLGADSPFHTRMNGDGPRW
ncbi:Gfo/Idh/MocA family oxidoreductase [Lipingzhangella sp. LS1_29]|uniref:Gfo/Idh/MocA family oxidoreductase n=1 Tax=Lipingzhangella rawalii TaxID=2055835 RepID=A0ABU2HAW9_9ACTN|nr:Gfo/Idh/MocA family oxidoreductase [Lipingzhangella rawalii]MDS1272403.1 Gfo/Idh/MocA family oxidoreductase [Lipingzhangella rawalii]